MAPRLGVVFPHDDLGADPDAVRRFATAAQELGFDHLLLYDHVLGADRPSDWEGEWWQASIEDPFQEVFVLGSHLAALTTGMEIATCVLVLPQRQTALVAKQAAALTILNGGRFRLGVGSGWNPLESEALGVTFDRTRGRRLDEQVQVLRALWTEPSVTFDGSFHQLNGVGIRPLPDRPIPVWFGAKSDVALRRLARVGDGWFAPSFTEPEEAELMILRLRQMLLDAGRAPDSIGWEYRIPYAGGPDAWRRRFDRWVELGATHVSLNALGAGLDADAHIRALETFAATLGISSS